MIPDPKALDNFVFSGQEANSSFRGFHLRFDYTTRARTVEIWNQLKTVMLVKVFQGSIEDFDFQVDPRINIPSRLLIDPDLAEEIQRALGIALEISKDMTQAYPVVLAYRRFTSQHSQT
jgi:hypothetical protein